MSLYDDPVPRPKSLSNIPGPELGFRDQLAMVALTGIMASGGNNPTQAGALAYEYADAMLKAREAKP